jgi:hypothetical protein
MPRPALLLGYWLFGELLVYVGASIVTGAGPFGILA